MESLTRLSQRYALGFVHALDTADVSDEILVENLIKDLSSRGRMKLLQSIVRELKKIYMQERKKEPCVEIAREEDREKVCAGVHELGISSYSVTVNPTLVRGWRVHAQGRLIDNTTKQALIELYRVIIR